MRRESLWYISGAYASERDVLTKVCELVGWSKWRLSLGNVDFDTSVFTDCSTMTCSFTPRKTNSPFIIFNTSTTYSIVF